MASERSGGFSLVELLLASALFLLVAAGVVGVLDAVARDDAIAREGAGAPAWVRAVFDLLERDLEGATRVRFTDEGAALLTHHGLDSTTLKPRSGPALIRYRVEEHLGSRWLVRREEALGPHLGDNARAELVARGVERLAISARRGEGEPWDLARPERATEETTHNQAAPLAGAAALEAQVKELKPRPERLYCKLTIEGAGGAEGGTWDRVFLFQ